MTVSFSKARGDVISADIWFIPPPSPPHSSTGDLHYRKFTPSAPKKNKLRWFVYVCQDIACDLIYVGSIVDVQGLLI